jgi:hypothetical protein
MLKARTGAGLAHSEAPPTVIGRVQMHLRDAPHVSLPSERQGTARISRTLLTFYFAHFLFRIRKRDSRMFRRHCVAAAAPAPFA